MCTRRACVKVRMGCEALERSHGLRPLQDSLQRFTHTHHRPSNSTAGVALTYARTDLHTKVHNSHTLETTHMSISE